ncbi:MAG: hypothetical protein HZY79_09060 [Rhodoblastus sp.]|nr:MAG: hypothetical protein HZY79_09060 [Rhodoblastus sp.]
MVKLRELERDAAASRAAYERFLKASATIAEDTPGGPSARIISPAVTPLGPASPKKIPTLIIALVAGLGVGVALALMLDFIAAARRRAGAGRAGGGAPPRRRRGGGRSGGGRGGARRGARRSGPPRWPSRPRAPNADEGGRRRGAGARRGRRRERGAGARSAHDAACPGRAGGARPRRLRGGSVRRRVGRGRSGADARGSESVAAARRRRRRSDAWIASGGPVRRLLAPARGAADASRRRWRERRRRAATAFWFWRDAARWRSTRCSPRRRRVRSRSTARCGSPRRSPTVPSACMSPRPSTSRQAAKNAAAISARPVAPSIS